MQHTKTPDEQGWYWIEDACGGWSMGYLLLSCEDPVLLLSDAIPDPPGELAYYTLRDGQWGDMNDYGELRPEAIRPIRWIGPLGCPGGDFHDNIAEFDAPRHDEAKAAGKAMVMLAVDFSYCDGHHYRVIDTGIVSREEADQISVFRTDGKP